MQKKKARARAVAYQYYQTPVDADTCLQGLHRDQSLVTSRGRKTSASLSKLGCSSPGSAAISALAGSPAEADGPMLVLLTVTFEVAMRMACQLRTEK